MDRNNNNIIEFPNCRKGHRLVDVTDQVFIKRQWEKQQKRATIAAALASIIVLALVINNWELNRQVKNQFVTMQAPLTHRLPASVVSEEGISQVNLAWEKSLIHSLSQEQTREIASLGRHPTPEEEFRFGFLEGKYHILFESGKIQKVHFLDSANSIDQPKYINNRESFLLKHRSLLPVIYDNVQRQNQTEQDGTRLETYVLMGHKEQPVGEVNFELDRHGRMLSMKVQKISRP